MDFTEELARWYTLYPDRHDTRSFNSLLTEVTLCIAQGEKLTWEQMNSTVTFLFRVCENMSANTARSLSTLMQERGSEIRDFFTWSYWTQQLRARVTGEPAEYSFDHIEPTLVWIGQQATQLLAAAHGLATDDEKEEVHAFLNAWHALTSEHHEEL